MWRGRFGRRFRSVFSPPRAAPSNGAGPGEVGEHCLRAAGPSCAAARHRESRRAVGAADRVTRGRLFFGDFLLATQKKARPRVRRGTRTRIARKRQSSQIGFSGPSPCSPPPLLGASRGDPKTAGSLASSPKIPFGLPLPSASSSSASRDGKKGEDCPSPDGASSAAPRCVCAAQSTRRSRRRSGRAFFLATFSWQDKKKHVRRSTAEPSD